MKACRSPSPTSGWVRTWSTSCGGSSTSSSSSTDSRSIPTGVLSSATGRGPTNSSYAGTSSSASRGSTSRGSGAARWPACAARWQLARERGEDDALLLGAVGRGIALAGTGALRPPGVSELQALGEDLREAAEHDLPGAHVLRLLLDPDDLLEVGVGAD